MVKAEIILGTPAGGEDKNNSSYLAARAHIFTNKRPEPFVANTYLLGNNEIPKGGARSFDLYCEGAESIGFNDVTAIRLFIDYKLKEDLFENEEWTARGQLRLHFNEGTLTTPGSDPAMHLYFQGKWQPWNVFYDQTLRPDGIMPRQEDPYNLSTICLPMVNGSVW